MATMLAVWAQAFIGRILHSGDAERPNARAPAKCVVCVICGSLVLLWGCTATMTGDRRDTLTPDEHAVDLVFALRTRQAEFMEGEPVEVFVWIKNIAARRCCIPNIFRYDELLFDFASLRVFALGGREPAMYQGEYLRTPDPGDLMPSVCLEPGEERTFPIGSITDATRVLCYELKPGKYLISMKLLDPRAVMALGETLYQGKTLPASRLGWEAIPTQIRVLEKKRAPQD